ncbi:hypothetical protein LO771_21990 [Streptacidiphilus sp. ASG 303]|uniref:hypothetical protein n=1 Tax=Streptacidiphilus sp. ASG 303 TaxID=2896847 RepID=UPI001E4E5652|nr:hypothetical protein [Streptacidiphilus sp. ASG 303]MCD0484981.1 hypothetical protein [Streptacidiphilus sp. ASG 303]
MFYLRLARGYRVLDLGRWILTAAAAAATAALLLRALGRALVDPPGTAVAVSAARLGWCLPALAATGWLAASCARALPDRRPGRIAGLAAAGAGPLRIRLLVAGETALACAAGSLLALVGFLVLRNDIAGAELAPEVGMGARLPAAAPLTLLLVVPLVAAAAAVAAGPLRDTLPGQRPESGVQPLGPLRAAAAPAAVAVGTALELYGRHGGGGRLHLPAGLGAATTAGAAGGVLALLGLVLTAPLLLAAAGRLLVAGRPYAVRLLAGRGLQAEAVRLGVPLGLPAVLAGAAVAAAQRWAAGHGPGGVLPVADAALVGLCAVAVAGVRLVGARSARVPRLDLVRRMGAGTGLVRRAALVRAGAAGSVLLLAAVGAAALTAAALR